MTEQEVLIRRMKNGEEGIVCRLAVEVFSEFVAPLYTQDGVSEFLRYIDPDLMSKRAKSNHFVLMAESDNRLVGIIEVRDFNHISLLFVLRESQRKGIAKQLLNEALNTSRSTILICPISVFIHRPTQSKPMSILDFDLKEERG